MSVQPRAGAFELAEVDSTRFLAPSAAAAAWLDPYFVPLSAAVVGDSACLDAWLEGALRAALWLPREELGRLPQAQNPRRSRHLAPNRPSNR